MAWWKHSKPADTAADPNLPLIRFEGITKIFKGDADEETRALDNVTLDIERGEYVVISGPSGCGKSTFLSMLALLDAPTGGRYTFNGRRVDQLSPAEKARVRNVEIGLIFQSFNLIGDMTVYENVEYPLTLRGVSGEDRKARVDAALQRVGLAPRAKQRPGSLSGGHQHTSACVGLAPRPKQRPGSLSGGHQQLVPIARRIAGRPPIVLADEPTGNLVSKSG